ncbi:hypothetical protein F751_0675 [Auxenochlorella protothecoides]|uniref:Uncharacterized protein n=1 Tax=Auxenochlorella protothecoides TaxID=3075 RepID=A0A087SQI5_AUXPR|nr:hypothetical protein F751_0675 [Auxenochlorella protothecoides]KFM27989.1 hypothetical protein F751_0675 [Auxenochlorella protothecoides]
MVSRLPLDSHAQHPASLSQRMGSRSARVPATTHFCTQEGLFAREVRRKFLLESSPQHLFCKGDAKGKR